MRASIRLFSFSGIAVKLHLTFALILVWAAWQWGINAGGGLIGALFGIAAILLLFVSVTLHEFGHALTAQAFGIATRDITLWPFGGLARLEEMPRNPVQELLITIAGPAVNVVIALVLGIVAVFVLRVQMVTSMREVVAALQSFTPTGLLIYLVVANVYLALFNLIPAFPMDGGRVLRALLAMRLEYPQATRIAVVVGQGMALLLGLFGVLNANLLLIAVAFFVYMAATQEGAMVQVKNVLDELVVDQAYARTAAVLNTTDTLQRPLDITLSSFQGDFAVTNGYELVGMLTRTDLVGALNRYGPGQSVATVMRQDFVTTHPGDSLSDAQRRMAEANVEAAPVVDGNRLVGLLTLRDIDEVYRLLGENPSLMKRRATPTARSVASACQRHL